MRHPVCAPLPVFAALIVTACAGTRLAPVPSVPSAEIAATCSADVSGPDVMNWRTVRADGLTFCVPNTWSLDERYQRVIAPLHTSGFASLSWTAPDTSQRVIIELPQRDFAKQQLKDDLEWCLQHGALGRVTREFGGREVSATYTGKGFSSGVVVTYPQPFVRVRAIGGEDAMTVAETIRPVASALP